MLNILQAMLQQHMNQELPDVQTGFRNVRGSRDQIASLCSIIEKAWEFQENIYFCFTDYAKAFGYVNFTTNWEIKSWGYQTALPISCETCMPHKKEQLELHMEQQTSSKLGKENIKAVYGHLVYLTYMQSTSCEILGWMKHKW